MDIITRQEEWVKVLMKGAASQGAEEDGAEAGAEDDGEGDGDGGEGCCW